MMGFNFKQNNRIDLKIAFIFKSISPILKLIPDAEFHKEAYIEQIIVDNSNYDVMMLNY